VAVLIRHRAAMTPAQYDESAPALVAMLRKQPGFVLHVSYEDGDGFVVAEVWETQEQHDAWFDANVKPNIPMEITQEVVDLHSVHKPQDGRGWPWLAERPTATGSAQMRSLSPMSPVHVARTGPLRERWSASAGSSHRPLMWRKYGRAWRILSAPAAYCLTSTVVGACAVCHR